MADSERQILQISKLKKNCKYVHAIKRYNSFEVGISAILLRPNIRPLLESSLHDREGLSQT